MFNLAICIRNALDLWQMPPLGEVSEEALMAAANRCVTQHVIDLDLTADAAFTEVVSDPFQFALSTDREKVLPNAITDDLSSIRRVESRLATSTSEDDWEEETITSFDNWNDVVERGDQNFVSFYGLRPTVTMVVARDVSNLEFRIVFRQLRAKINTPTEVLELPEIYEALFTYDIALEIGELIDNQSESFAVKKASKMPYLFQRRQDAYDRMERWRRNQKGSSLTHRRPFNDRRLDNTTRSRRRRFTIHY